MNLAITISRWILDHRAHHAAQFLQQCRVRREREMVKQVAREMRESMGLPAMKGLK